MKWLQDFVREYFPRMPAPLQAIVYFMLVATLIYGIVRVLGGEYAVHGQVYVKTADGKKTPAKNFDVQIDDKFYGTNSKGLYYLVLSTTAYGQLIANRSLPLTIAQGDDSWPEEPKLDLLKINFSKLDDITIDLTSPTASPGHVARGFEIISSAYADGITPPTDRLFVEAIDLRGTKSEGIEEGSFNLTEGSATRTLMTTSHKPAGALPLLAHDAVDFGSRYYFEVAHAKETVTIKLASDTGVFSSYEERFFIPLPLRYGAAFTFRGDHGGKITVRQLSPVDITVWSRADTLALVPALQQALAADGIRVIAQEAPLGDHAETNSIFIGAGVPYQVAQKVLGALAGSRIPLKSIKYDRSLKSGNASEIQIGSTKYLQSRPPIPPQKLQQAIAASNESVFRASIMQ